MRAACLAMVLAACGGDGSADTADTDTDGTTSPVDLCDGIPSFDLDGLTCEQLADAMMDTVDAADRCTTKDDCQVLRAECEHWVQVGCHYVANTCLENDLWNEFNAKASGCAVGGMVCECGSPPDAECVSGKCQFVYE